MTLKVGILTANEDAAYGSIKYFIERLEQALERQQAKTIRFAESAQSFNDFVNFQADFTLSFGTLAYQSNRQLPLYDEMRKPHIFWCIDDPITCGMSYLKSAYIYYLAIDRKHRNFLNQIQRRDCSEFVPLGTVVPERSARPTERHLDIVFTGHVGNLNDMVKKWDENPQAKNLLMEMADLCLSDLRTPIYLHMQRYIKTTGLQINTEAFQYLFQQLYHFVRAHKRKLVLQSIRSHKIHIFGGCEDPEIASQPNVELHSIIPYHQIFEVYDTAKMAINVTPNYYDSCHDRTIASMAYGAMTITDLNPYMSELFQDENDILFYDFDESLAILDEKIDAVIGSNDRLEAAALSSRAILADRCSWDVRAGQILKFAQSIVNHLNHPFYSMMNEGV